jgi:hypothetical protein
LEQVEYPNGVEAVERPRIGFGKSRGFRGFGGRAKGFRGRGKLFALEESDEVANIARRDVTDVAAEDIAEEDFEIIEGEESTVDAVMRPKGFGRGRRGRAGKGFRRGKGFGRGRSSGKGRIGKGFGGFGKGRGKGLYAEDEEVSAIQRRSVEAAGAEAEVELEAEAPIFDASVDAALDDTVEGDESAVDAVMRPKGFGRGRRGRGRAGKGFGRGRSRGFGKGRSGKGGFGKGRSGKGFGGFGKGRGKGLYAEDEEVAAIQARAVDVAEAEVDMPIVDGAVDATAEEPVDVVLRPKGFGRLGRGRLGKGFGGSRGFGGARAGKGRVGKGSFGKAYGKGKGRLFFEDEEEVAAIAE